MKTLDKLAYIYSKAEGALVQKRNELYPVGTKGICITTGVTVEIVPGSLYADQINTTQGHMSWRNFQRIN